MDDFPVFPAVISRMHMSRRRGSAPGAYTMCNEWETAGQAEFVPGTSGGFRDSAGGDQDEIHLPGADYLDGAAGRISILFIPKRSETIRLYFYVCMPPCTIGGDIPDMHGERNSR